MAGFRYAIIDIGSNSIRFRRPDERNKLVVTTRLGEGIAENGMLREANMDRSIKVVRAMAANARHMGFVPAAYATSAVRDAKNQSEFVNRVFEACGVRVDVLSGEREAEYAFRAAAEPNGGLIDIGGASFQLVAEGFRMSFPMGCVRGRDIAQSKANVRSCDECWQKQQSIIRDEVAGLLRLPRIRIDSWVGVGGTITSLAAVKLRLETFDIERVDSTRLTHDDIIDLIDELSGLGERRRLDPMLKARHDVILYGAAILEAVMDGANIPEVSVSTRDGMEGYLDYLETKTS